MRWTIPALVAAPLVALAISNTDFYFHRYYADPDSLVRENYRTAQGYYEIQTMQSRYQAALGPNYVVRTVGQADPPYDPETTAYLVKGQDWAKIANPETEMPIPRPPGKGLAFIFFPGNEQYQAAVIGLYPGGAEGEVLSQGGRHLFYTYVLAPGR